MKVTKGWTHLIGIGLGALLLAASGGTSAQDMYRWVDAQGKVHYSDQPPPADAREFKSLNPSGLSQEDPLDEEVSEDSDDVQDEAPSYVQQEQDFERRQAEQAEQQAKQQQAEAEAAERKRNCEMARSNYNTISVGGRITRVNAAGEREFLSDEEIKSETAKARQMMQQWCDD